MQNRFHEPSHHTNHLTSPHSPLPHFLCLSLRALFPLAPKHCRPGCCAFSQAQLEAQAEELEDENETLQQQNKALQAQVAVKVSSWHCHFACAAPA